MIRHKQQHQRQQKQQVNNKQQSNCSINNNKSSIHNKITNNYNYNNKNNNNNQNNNQNNNNQINIVNNLKVDDKAKMVHDPHKSATSMANVVNATSGTTTNPNTNTNAKDNNGNKNSISNSNSNININININNNNNNASNNNSNNNNNSNSSSCSSSSSSNTTTSNIISNSISNSNSNSNNGSTNINNISSSNSNNSSTFAYLPRSRSQFTPMSDASNASFSSASVAGSIQDDLSERCSLTQAGLEEYNIRYQPVLFHHQKQSSYAQSEGYHSYVSSSDSSSATPLLDRLRQETDLLSRQSHHWSQNDLSSVSSLSVASSPTPLLLSLNGVDPSNGLSKQTGNNITSGSNNNNSSESTSSTETLKWLGSMSDVSEASHATGYSAIAESVSSSQLIVHSSRVLTPKRHHSESVLYLNDEQPPGCTSVPLVPTTSTAGGIKPTLRTTHLATVPNHRHSPSYPPVHSSTASTHAYHMKQNQHQHHNHHHHHHQQNQLFRHEDPTECSLMSAVSASALYSGSGSGSSSVGVGEHEPRKSLGQSHSTGDLQHQHQHQLQHQHPHQHKQLHKSSISVKISNSEAVATISPQPPTTTKTTTAESPTAIITATQQQQQQSPSNSSNDILQLHLQSKTELSSSTPNVANNSADVVNATTATTTTTSTMSMGTGTTSSSSPSIASTTSTASLASGNGNSSSSSSNDSSYRNDHRLFPVSTYTEPVHSNTSHYVHHPKPQYSVGLPKSASIKAKATITNNLNVTTHGGSHTNLPGAGISQPTWQSVAELINDFEKTNNDQQQQQQQMPQQQQHQQQQQLQQKYAYLEPSKTHRVSNPALKAFQKNAVQSYFERQQQQQQQHQQQQQQLSREGSLQKSARHSPQEHQMLRSHSYQVAGASSMETHVEHQQILRKSLPNSFAKTNMLGIPHMNSSSTDLLLENGVGMKPPSPAPPPPPPRSRSLMPNLLRRSSSASEYADFREQYQRSMPNKLQETLPPTSLSPTTTTTTTKTPTPSPKVIKNISNAEKMSFNDCGMPPPPPPPRNLTSLPARRTSSASEYAAMRDKLMLKHAAALAHQQHHPQQHHPHNMSGTAGSNNYFASASHGPPSANWAPERPPKNPNLRVPSPDLPPPPNAEIDTSFPFSDEPLPPPPPEILQRQPYGGDPLQQALPPNRRNSFAGSSTRKANATTAPLVGRSSSTQNESQAKVPPLVPKKPTMLLQATRPASSLAQTQTNKAHKIILNGSINVSMEQSNSKMSTNNRKRPHNPAAMSSVPPILENVNLDKQTSKPTAIASKPPIAPSAAILKTKSSPPPPPLMPRMSNNQQQHHHHHLHPIFQQHSPTSATSNTRCNSKASYLPRQSLEKLNNTDPDHGSYKLTLTSNEDLVAHTKPAKYEMLATNNGKLPPNSNLPDVLPLGVKLQTQSQSVSVSASDVTMRYGSNNNLANNSTPTTANSPTHQMAYNLMYSTGGVAQPQTPLAQPPQAHRYSTPANMGMNMNSNVVHSPNYARSQSYDLHNSNTNNSPTKFMSQSTVDLKKTAYNLETTLEHVVECGSISSINSSSNNNSISKLISPAQSNCSLSSNGSSSNGGHARGSSSTLESNEYSATEFIERERERERANLTEGRIFRAELVNTSLSSSPAGVGANSNSNCKTPLKSPVSRQDSLRENIEKITQLQSQLMSAHLCDTLLSGYGNNKSSNNSASTGTLVPSITEEAQSTENETINDVINQLVEETINTVANTTPEIIAQPLDNDIDSLKLVQRSEIVLRVNPTTAEIACQTDDLPDGDMGRMTLHNAKEESETLQRTTLQPRQLHPIELAYELLAQDLVALLAPNHKLIEILKPKTRKPTSAYVSNLYNPCVPVRPAKRDVGTSTLMRMRSQHELVERNLVAVELQFAELDIALINGDEDVEKTNLIKQNLNELIKQLNQKIKTLTREQQTMSEECTVNDKLGKCLLEKLAEKVRPSEASKVRTYIDDVGHITSLLLSLSERLSQTEATLSANASNNSSNPSGETTTLTAKRERLFEQLEEAKRLKSDIDRRGNSIANLLEKHLNDDDCADYDYFINMKAKLIADTRDIAERIKCSEEQLNTLRELFVQSDC